jgi:hypothetical protein
VLTHLALTAAEKGIEVPLTEAPAGFVRPHPDTIEAAVPEPTPDGFRVEAEAFGDL